MTNQYKIKQQMIVIINKFTFTFITSVIIPYTVYKFEHLFK